MKSEEIDDLIQRQNFYKIVKVFLPFFYVLLLHLNPFKMERSTYRLENPMYFTMVYENEFTVIFFWLIEMSILNFIYQRSYCG